MIQSRGPDVGFRGRTYRQADLDAGPDNDRLTVRVTLEVGDGEDAENLDDGDEESEGEQTAEDDLQQACQLVVSPQEAAMTVAELYHLLLELQLEFPDDG